MPTLARPQSGILIPHIPKRVTLSPVADDQINEGQPDAKTIGLRCAWCGKILREPIRFLNPQNHWRGRTAYVPTAGSGLNRNALLSPDAIGHVSRLSGQTRAKVNRSRRSAAVSLINLFRK